MEGREGTSGGGPTLASGLAGFVTSVDAWGALDSVVEGGWWLLNEGSSMEPKTVREDFVEKRDLRTEFS